ncbi:MAG: molecular chaperone DnaK [Myxococcota bacterium]|nr:molecular chaperone DnaK [Myxococcota bacterium]
MAYAIGIDLGTSNSVVSVCRDGKPLVIADEEGNRTHPSMVSFGHGQSVIVGNRAQRQLVYNPQGTVFSAKRLIGRAMSSEEVRRAQEMVPYEIVQGDRNDPRIEVRERVYSLQEISAHVLRFLKQLAESYLGEEVSQAVITVPAYFNDNQRQATRDAGRIAGLEVLRIINEPTAAALAYGLGQAKNEHVAVYDLGGGTFDISVLHIMGDVFEVVSTAGDTFLGGDDFDNAVVEHLLSLLSGEDLIAVKRSPLARLKFKQAAEAAKIALSTSDETEVVIEAVLKDARGGDQDFVSRLTRLQYNQLIFPLVKRTFEVCDEALKAVSLHPSDIAAVVPVGGMTRSPIIQEAVQNYFGRNSERGVNPDEVVAVGASIQAANLMAAADGERASSLLIDVTPQSLGVGTVGGFVERLIERNTAIPVVKTKSFTTSVDEQVEVKIEVFQGESRMSMDNEKLGEFILEGLRPAPRGDTRVSVSFDIDANGIVNVTAEDEDTRKAASIRLEASTGLSEDEVEELKFDSLDF